MLRVSLNRRPAVAAFLAIGLLAASTLTDRAGAQDAPSPSVPDPSVTAPEATDSPVGELPPDTTVPPEATMPTEAPTTAPNRHEEVGPATTTTLAGSTTAVPDTTVVPPPVDGVVEGQTEAVPLVAPALVDLPVRGRGAARVVAGVPARVNALVKDARDANAEMIVRLDEATAANQVTAAAVASAQERMDHMSAKQRATAAELAARGRCSRSGCGGPAREGRPRRSKASCNRRMRPSSPIGKRWCSSCCKKTPTPSTTICRSAHRSTPPSRRQTTS